jgi:hypothetical protein
VKDTKYLIPSRDGVLDSPQTSLWTSPNNLSTHDVPSFRKFSLCCLPHTKLSQKVSSSYLFLLMFSIGLFCNKSSMFSTPRWPKHSCHNWTLFDYLERIRWTFFISPNFVSHGNQYRQFFWMPNPTISFNDLWWCIFFSLNSTCPNEVALVIKKRFLPI